MRSRLPVLEMRSTPHIPFWCLCAPEVIDCILGNQPAHFYGICISKVIHTPELTSDACKSLTQPNLPCPSYNDFVVEYFDFSPEVLGDRRVPSHRSERDRAIRPDNNTILTPNSDYQSHAIPSETRLI